MSRAHSACFLDFDHTLFQTDEFFHLDVRESFLRLGIDTSEWEESYAEVWPTGYNLEKHAEEISRHYADRLPLEEMKRVLRESFSDLRRYLFPDVVPFLERAKQNGTSLYLVSFGDGEWQRYKVSACAVGGYFQGMFFASTPGGKSALVQELVKGFSGNVFAVDNNPADLDLIRDQAPEIRTYHMNRVPDDMRVPADDVTRLRYLEARRYLERVPRHQHVLCCSLDGLPEEAAHSSNHRV